MPNSSAPRVTAVVLGYGTEEILGPVLTAALSSTDVDLDIVLVDNGVVGGVDQAISGLPQQRLTLVTPGTNTGFTGGCRLGAEQATGEYLLLLNSDAVVEPGTVRALIDALDLPEVELAMADVRLGDQPEVINTNGNPLHVTALTWSGGMGEPAGPAGPPREVVVASGACVAMRHSWWQALDGFADEYFAFGEDTELSLRTWRRGRRVVLVPGAVVYHHYEFSRSPMKYFLVERNRLILLTTLMPGRVLAMMSPLLLATEGAMTALAVKQGWFSQKAKGWQWAIHHTGWLRRRHQQLRAEQTITDDEFLKMLTTNIDQAIVELPKGLTRTVDVVFGGYWKVVRAVARRTDTTERSRRRGIREPRR